MHVDYGRPQRVAVGRVSLEIPEASPYVAGGLLIFHPNEQDAIRIIQQGVTRLVIRCK